MELAQSLTSFGRAGLNLWWVIIDLVREREERDWLERDRKREEDLIGDGSARIVEEDDRDAGGDGRGEGPTRLQRPVRPPPHTPQQVPSIGVLPPLEV